MTLDFVTVYVKDLEATTSFYQDLFGFEVARRFSPRPGMSIVFMKDSSGHKIEFISDEKGTKFAGSGISLGFYVDDTFEVEKKLKSRNVEITFGPQAMPNGIELLNAKDLNGLELIFVRDNKVVE